MSSRSSSRKVLLVLPPCTLVLFSLYLGFAPARDAAAQATVPPPPSSGRISRIPPAPIRSDGFVVEQAARIVQPVAVQNVVAFETEFVGQLNAAIRNPEALTAGRAKVIVVVDTKAVKGAVETRAIVIVESPSAVRLSTAQIQELRDVITRQIDAAVQSEIKGTPAVAKLGSGTMRQGVFSGTLQAGSAVTTRPNVNW